MTAFPNAADFCRRGLVLFLLQAIEQRKVSRLDQAPLVEGWLVPAKKARRVIRSRLVDTFLLIVRRETFWDETSVQFWQCLG